MALTSKPGGKFEVTITKAPTRHTAEATLERLFMRDKAVRGPIETRAKNHAAQPKRRGGRIWTKYPNKLHPSLTVGRKATISATSQYAKDLDSVAEFVEVKTV